MNLDKLDRALLHREENGDVWAYVPTWKKNLELGEVDPALTGWSFLTSDGMWLSWPKDQIKSAELKTITVEELGYMVTERRCAAAVRKGMTWWQFQQTVADTPLFAKRWVG